MNKRISSISSFSNTVNRVYDRKFHSIINANESPAILSVDKYAFRSDSEFQKLMNRLDAVASGNSFASSNIVLEPEHEQRGFLEQDQAQNFQVLTKGKQMPLNVKVVGGQISAYVSFRTPAPSESNCEYIYKKNSFKIGTGAANFQERHCFLAIQAKRDCNIVVSCFFGNVKPDFKLLRRPNFSEEEVTLKTRTPIAVKSKTLIKPLRRYRTPSQEQVKLRIKQRDVHSSMVQLRKKQNYEDSKQRFILQIQSKNIMELAQTQGMQVLHVKRREAKFCREWILFLYLALGLSKMKKSVDDERKSKMINVNMFLSAWKIQKNFKKKFSDDFPLKARLLQRGKEYLMLFRFVAKPYYDFYKPERLRIFMNLSRYNFNPPKKVVAFTKKVKLIQKTWRKYQTYKIDLFDEISILWDFIVNEIEKNATDRKRKKKNEIALSQIPLGIKNQCITEYIEEAKKVLVSEILKGYKIVYWKYWPSDRTLISMIKSAATLNTSKKLKKKKTKKG